MRKKDKNESSQIKLVHYCRRYLPMMIIALIGAGIGTALTLFGPDKLSEMTDLMTE